MSDPPAGDDARGVYGISVAAELTEVGVQNIRAYERRGLLEPARTEGGTRRYSNDDLTRLRRIRDLLAGGLNLAGIVMVLQLECENADLRAEVNDSAGRIRAGENPRSNRGHHRRLRSHQFAQSAITAQGRPPHRSEPDSS